METAGRRILTQEFTAEQWRCHDGSPVPDELLSNARRIHATVWQVKAALEAERGLCLEVELVSGYRSPAHNAKVGGKPKSEHMQAMAADVRMSPLPPDVVANKVEKMTKAKEMPAGGLGRYDTFTHIDVRGYRARWDERTTHGDK